jgi:putative ABC transport system ATP-binding protein
VGRERRAVLRDVTLEVWPGDVIAIWGARRTGKTTLLRIAAGIEPPDSGSVLVGGCDVLARPAGERTRRLRQIGYASREWRIADGKPVLDHVALPLLADGRPLATAMAKAHETLERVGAAGCVDAAGDELTQLDLARITLARALVREPRVLLVDEPGGIADADERDVLLRLLRSLASERRELAIVLTARDVAGLSSADRVMTLGDGGLRTHEAPAHVVPFPIRGAVPASPVP